VSNIEVVVMLTQGDPFRRASVAVSVPAVEGKRLRWLIAQAGKQGLEDLVNMLVRKMEFEGEEIPWESLDPTTFAELRVAKPPIHRPPPEKSDGSSCGGVLLNGSEGP